VEKYQEYLQAVKEYQEYERKIKAKIVSLKTVMQEEGVQEELKAELQQMEKNARRELGKLAAKVSQKQQKLMAAGAHVKFIFPFKDRK